MIYYSTGKGRNLNVRGKAVELSDKMAAVLLAEGLVVETREELQRQDKPIERNAYVVEVPQMIVIEEEIQPMKKQATVRKTTLKVDKPAGDKKSKVKKQTRKTKAK